MENMQEIKQIRHEYTRDTYSPKFTKELLFNLYQFLNMEIVKEKQLFSEYDKASLLCAIEIIDQQQDKIERLEEVLEDRTGDVVHYHEENERLKDKFNELWERVEVIQDVLGFKL